jgi:restriction system protein
MTSKVNVYVLRAEFGRYTDSFEKEGYIGIGWFDENPISWDLSNKEFLKEKYRNKFPNDPNMRVNQNVGQIFRFVNEIKVGDIVISPYMDNRLLIGKIDSDLYFKIDSTSPYPWRKSVKWINEKIDRHTLSVPLQNTLRSSLTCFNVNSADEILIQLGLINDNKTTFNLTNNEPISNYELIRKRFLELDATEFEYLVSFLLRTLGFEPTQEIGKVGDGGIDFEGILDVSGVASINLQVQVKRYDKGAIGEKEIRNFRGALKKDYQGCFITLSTFNKKAKDSATDKDREQIQLIDGNRFIEIFIEQYDKIIDEMYNDDMDELSNKLKFKKSLLPI